MKNPNIKRLPMIHPYIDITHFATIEGETVFFYNGIEPEEDETQSKYVAGWRAIIGEKEYGDFVTLKDGVKDVLEAYEILFDQAQRSIIEIKK